MWNAGLDDSQAGIKTGRRYINTLIYADDTTLMAEREEELNSLLTRVKEESEKAGLKLNIQKTRVKEESEKAGLKLNIKKTKIMACGLTTRANTKEKSESSDRFYFPGLQNHCGQWLQPWN